MLGIARREAPGGDYRHLSLTDLDQLTESFDGVFAQASLLHIPKADVGEVIRKMAERAKPCGLVYLAVKEARASELEEEVKKESDLGYEYERFFSYFTMKELEQYLAQAGLNVVWQERTLSGKTVWLQIIAQK